MGKLIGVALLAIGVVFTLPAIMLGSAISTFGTILIIVLLGSGLVLVVA